jgi:hypothetical protein
MRVPIRNGNKMSDVATNNTVEQTEQKKTEIVRGDRGEVGTPTASLTIKQQYHATYFTREDANNKQNPNKKKWVRNHGAPSLKRFARSLLAKGDQTAKDWFDCKHGALNAKRSDANEKAAREAATATRLERRKNSAKSSGGK